MTSLNMVDEIFSFSTDDDGFLLKDIVMEYK